MRTNLTLILMLTTILNTECVVIKMKKQNVFIQSNSNYTYKLDIIQTKSQINPITVSIQHTIYNSLGTTNQYFDFFKYLSKEDIACYNYSIGNSSYLYPCPFLLNNYKELRVYNATDSITDEKDSLDRQVSEVHNHFIVDNTPYPFPNGAYPYTDLWITTSVNLQVQFQDKFKEPGIRLIFITVTMILIYSVVIGILVYRTRKVQREMFQRSPNYNLKRRPSQMSRQNNQIKQQDQQSDIDNYERIIADENSLRNSRESRQIVPPNKQELQFRQVERGKNNVKSQQSGRMKQIRLFNLPVDTTKIDS